MHIREVSHWSKQMQFDYLNLPTELFDRISDFCIEFRTELSHLPSMDIRNTYTIL